MDNDGQRWMEMDSDGYIITHKGFEKGATKYFGQRTIAIDSDDGQRWIEMDNNGYILSHTMDKRRQQWNTMHIWIQTDRNRQRWMLIDILVHSMDKRRQQWSNKERDGQRLIAMDSDVQRWIEMETMDSDEYEITLNG